MAVIKAVQQFHAAMEAWDTVSLKGMLAPGTAQVRGHAAYVYTVSRIESRAAGGAIQGNEAESIVLSRLGNIWFIEMFHTSVGSDQ